MNFGKETMFKVEVRAMLEGLLLAWDKGYPKIEVDYDNELLVKVLLSGGGAHSNLSKLRLLHQLFQHKWEVHVKCISQDQNGDANHMAKYATTRESMFHLFATPPSSVIDLLAKDRHVIA